MFLKLNNIDGKFLIWKRSIQPQSKTDIIPCFDCSHDHLRAWHFMIEYLCWTVIGNIRRIKCIDYAKNHRILCSYRL